MKRNAPFHNIFNSIAQSIKTAGEQIKSEQIRRIESVLQKDLHSRSGILPHGIIKNPYLGNSTIFTVVMLSILLGLLASTGSVLATLAPIAMVVILFLTIYPWLFIWLIIFSALTIVGAVRLYLPDYQAIRWAYPPLAIAIPLAIYLLQKQDNNNKNANPLPAVFWLAMAFVLISIISVFLNWPGYSSAALGIKNYFQVWAILLSFAIIGYRGDFTRPLIVAIISIALLQLPFVFHQWLYIMPQRIGYLLVSPDDVIAGTFGADYYGGGNNAVLSAYLIITIGILISLWKEGAIKLQWLILGASLLVFPIFLNETKIAVFYFWLMFIVIYWEDIIKRPMHFIFGNIVLILFLILFIAIYSHIAASDGHRINGISDYLEFIKEQNLNVGYGKYSLNRWTSLTFWYREHIPNDYLHAIIGHGTGQSQEGGVLLTSNLSLASKRYQGMGIGLTAVTSLLWDVGLLGFTIISLLFLSAYKLAGNLVRLHKGNNISVALYKGLQVAVAIIYLSLTHKNFFVFELSFQALFIMIIGYLIYAARFSKKILCAQTINVT